MSQKVINFHDFKKLIISWRKLCKQKGLMMRSVEQLDGLPVMEVTSPALQNKTGIYISAGIHGDEPAGVTGLLDWAMSKKLASIPLVLYPCLNPWGLINNSRFDSLGNDLNRIWDNDDHPLVQAVSRKIQSIELCLSLNLHEDYDGQGIYLYEPKRGGRSDSFAEKILSSAESIIRRDCRKTIEGGKVRDGIIRPRLHNLPKEGKPEAVYLYENQRGRNFTLETPSEFAFQDRRTAHKLMIECAVNESGY
jgi:protein MpaA